MASSISRQDESIPFVSLATGAAKMELSFPLGTTEQSCDITGCITLKLCWKFRVIMGEETCVLSSPNV